MHSSECTQQSNCTVCIELATLLPGERPARDPAAFVDEVFAPAPATALPPVPRGRPKQDCSRGPSGPYGPPMAHAPAAGSPVLIPKSHPKSNPFFQ